MFEEINKYAEVLSEKDIETWVLPQVMTQYDARINYLAKMVYGNTSKVAYQSFKEQCSAILEEALVCFYLKKEHYLNDRDLNTYLLLILKRYSNELKRDIKSEDTILVPVCPACKLDKLKIKLQQADKRLICTNCQSKIENGSTSRLHLCFSNHSKKGYKCPDCNRFIPASLSNNGNIVCPYDDCIFFGNESDLLRMNHPVMLSTVDTISLNKKINKGESETTIGDLISFSGEQKSCISVNESCLSFSDTSTQVETESELDSKVELIMGVINEQANSLERMNLRGTIVQKSLMYEAYKNIVTRYPIDMVSYLVNRKACSEFALQAKIFQEYVSLIEDSLPLTIEKCGVAYEVFSLLDQNLGLFQGISEFQGQVSGGRIKNATVEHYIGGVKMKDYGPCFLGKIMDITDLDGNSIKNKIIEYDFVNIAIDVEEQPVIVRHYRIPSHYELGSLAYLQRVRKKIVDRIYFKLNGVKRKPGES